MPRFRISLLLLLLVFALAACDGGRRRQSGDGGDTGSGGSSGRPRVAFVTNGPASFWTIAEAGAKAAAAKFDVECEVKVPANGIVDQQRILEDLLANQIDGIAVSPIDAANQSQLLNDACGRTKLITHDSDAPDTARLCYIGMDNYEAGRLCGGLVKEALPDGGKIMIFVGRLEQDNARKRRQGVIDELLGRSKDSSRFDPPGKELTGGKYTILDTRTDQFDLAKAKANAEDTMALHEDLACMVGLFAYNSPACLEAVKSAGKTGKIKIVSFDEDDQTLQGILDGHIHGTVCQQPYEYGFQSVKMLASLARGDRSVIPDGKFQNIPATLVRKGNARAFWDKLKKTLADAEK